MSDQWRKHRDAAWRDYRDNPNETVANIATRYGVTMYQINATFSAIHPDEYRKLKTARPPENWPPKPRYPLRWEDRRRAISERFFTPLPNKPNAAPHNIPQRMKAVFSVLRAFRRK